MEIFVSAIILALIMVGMVNIFISGKRYVLHSRARMTGGEIGKIFIDPLQLYVHQTQSDPANSSLDAWDAPDNTNNLLSIHNQSTPTAPNLYCGENPDSTTNLTPQWQDPNQTCSNATRRQLNNITYWAEYTIGAPIANTPDLRKVKVEILWNEPSL